ncbi:LL-diaminopimelate aminotransferase [Candidatus Magnetomonas plexicatena]|uniref:LL-diaminopimelate aminotransferase n=1 Tax=Candidatus Magnetomonas plexicatena TaxID=2552947 RepID=UPI001C74C885|nr:LL-diaminopimelate aminotransferase [Nitrospirales bacterium LBB_01]
MKTAITVHMADRVKNLPPYLFERIDKLKREALKRGADLIDLSIGDPDIPTPEHIVKALQGAAQNPAHHRYPSYEGMLSFRKAVADWYSRRFQVNIKPENEVLSLIGSKEGIGHIPLAFVNPGDVVLCPSPGYPVYSVGTLFAGGFPYFMPLRAENDFKPDFTQIPEEIYKRAKLMFLNYPNNPTSACASREFFGDAIDIAYKYNIIICHDAAYSEIYYDGNKPLSFLEVDGAKDVGIEFHSLSKTYNMTGWRVGFAVGNKDVIFGLGKIKTNLDSGVFQAIQEAAICALETDDSVLCGIRDTYQSRRDALYDGLSSIGLTANKPDATFYLWSIVPEGFTSETFSAYLLEKAAVMATPGNGFGDSAEGYIRFALTVPVARIKEAVERIKKIL